MQNNNIDIEKLRSYINDLEEQITPLTKTKSKSKKTKSKPKKVVLVDIGNHDEVY
jgi:prefoldin subunit 5